MTSPNTADLLDVNVWLALVAEAHPHHDRATAYWNLEAASRILFCRITHLALLRHLTNQTIMGLSVLKSAAAWKLCERLLALPEVQLSSEPPGLHEHLAKYCERGKASPNLWTDAYLAAFARCADVRLVTFDRGFFSFSELKLQVLEAK